MGQGTEELNSQIEDTRQRMADDLEALQDRVSPSAIVERRKQAARTKLSSMKDRLMGTAQSIRDSASSATSSVSATTSGSGESFASTAQEQFDGAPLAAGLVAFGAGIVLASLLPASHAEAEAAHQVVETAKKEGQPLLDEAQSAGAEVVQNVKQSAADAAQQVKQSAQESVQKVKDEGRSSTEKVREESDSDPPTTPTGPHR
jgi:gas vesicle protein